jgi:hypothetical protein
LIDEYVVELDIVTVYAARTEQEYLYEANRRLLMLTYTDDEMLQMVMDGFV